MPLAMGLKPAATFVNCIYSCGAATEHASMAAS
jgi:hypothetical protein